MGAVLLNFYAHMNHNDVKFDIIIDDLPSVKNGSLNEDAFKKMGCNIFRVTPKSQNMSENIRRSASYEKRQLRYSPLKYGGMDGAVLQARKKYGIKTRIAHAHLAYVNNPSFVKR